MKRRYVQLKNGKLVEVETTQSRGHIIIPDLPGYQSPVTGKWVEGRVQRREDLKRNGCRPWEGLEQEKKEAQRQTNYQEQDLDRRLDKTVRESFYQLPPSKRDILSKC